MSLKITGSFGNFLPTLRLEPWSPVYGTCLHMRSVVTPTSSFVMRIPLVLGYRQTARLSGSAAAAAAAADDDDDDDACRDDPVDYMSFGIVVRQSCMLSS